MKLIQDNIVIDLNPPEDNGKGKSVDHTKVWPVHRSLSPLHKSPLHKTPSLHKSLSLHGSPLHKTPSLHESPSLHGSPLHGSSTSPHRSSTPPHGSPPFHGLQSNSPIESVHRHPAFSAY